MQVKKHRWKKGLLIIFSLLVIVALLHTKFAVRCMLVGRLSWEVAFSSESDVDCIDEKKGLVFHNRDSLIWLRQQVWGARIEWIPPGTQFAAFPAPWYYVGNTYIGNYGNLWFIFLISSYTFFIEEDRVLRNYAADCVMNGAMQGIAPYWVYIGGNNKVLNSLIGRRRPHQSSPADLLQFKLSPISTPP